MTRSGTRVSVSCAITLGLVLAALPALAQKAGDLYKASAVAYKTGEFQKALDLLDQACRMTPDEKCDYNAGRIYEKMGRPKDAAARYRKAIEGHASKAVIAKARERLSAVLPSLPGRLELRTGLEGAEVLIDGKPVGRTPLPVIELIAGNHEVQMTHPEYDDASAWTTIAPDQTARVSLAPNRSIGVVEITSNVATGFLVVDDGDRHETPFPARVLLPTGEHRLVVTVAGSGRAESFVTVKKNGASRVDLVLKSAASPTGSGGVSAATGARSRPAWAWVLAAGGASAVAAGGVMTWLAERDRDKVRAAKADIAAGHLPSINMSDAANLERSGNRKALGAYVLYGVGGAAALAGAVVLIVGVPDKAGGMSLIPVPGGAVATFQATF
jgi:hypothetical protein